MREGHTMSGSNITPMIGRLLSVLAASAIVIVPLLIG